MVTKRTAQLMHLDPDKVELLKELAAETRIPKSALMREAIDDLLVKHRKLRRPQGKTRSGLRRC
jgi:predicted transcriptional regulator